MLRWCHVGPWYHVIRWYLDLQDVSLNLTILRYSMVISWQWHGFQMVNHHIILWLTLRFNISFILESIDFILKNNEYFLQLQGTAMGTVFAPTYANLSMGYHEIKLYDLIELNYSVDIRQYFVEKTQLLKTMKTKKKSK